MAKFLASWCVLGLVLMSGGKLMASEGCCVGEMTEGLRAEMAGYEAMVDELMEYVASGNRAKAQALVRGHLTRQDLELENRLTGGLIRSFTGNGPYGGYEQVAVQRVSSRLHKLHFVMHFRDKVVKGAVWLREFDGVWYFTESDLEKSVVDFEKLVPYVFLLEETRTLE